jgi:chloramphenicol-sensitive protein RarD
MPGGAPPGPVPGAAQSAGRNAVLIGFLCNAVWGATSALFILVHHLGASPWEIAAERALWSAPCAALFVLLAGQAAEVRRILRCPRTVALLALSALAIGSGWVVYVWAVDNGRNIESSLGYFISPLLNMAAGWVLFRERIDGFGAAAVVLAVIGVGVQALALGHPPFLALFLAATFWTYSLVRRQVAVSAVAGLLVETCLLSVPAAGLQAWLVWSGQAGFGHSLALSLVLPLVGPATAAPLAIYAWTARRLPFSVLGFLQFVSPSMGFLVGLAVGERLSLTGLVSFLFIWAGAGVFTLGAWRAGRRIQPDPRAA